MKTKLVFFIASLLMISEVSFSQSLIFCDRADVNGKAVNANTIFTVPKNGGPVTLLFTAAASAKPASVSFDVYRLDNGKEVFISTIKQALNGSQNFVAKQMTFYDAGRYRVYVFDTQDKPLARSEVLIKK
ncbi:MAG TPA: hypothetical protein VE978_14740 [Chitinophagales bacterium]|nr:hypothetical protein [Chitinophagales bacterium]